MFAQPFGRFFHLPRQLAERGHEVHLLLLGYRNEPGGYRQIGNLHLHAAPALPWGPLPYVNKASALAQMLRPDWVIGFSDIWYGLLADRLAHRYATRFLVDAYDNYESYMPWAKPLHWLWRRAISRADLVTAAGPELADWMCRSSGRESVGLVPMAADPDFAPRDKLACRRRIGLNETGPLVGYSGALYPNRGIEFLFDVYRRLRESRPDVGLVLSGRLAKGVELPEGVEWLGYRPPEDVPDIINSLDLMFVVNKPGSFGDYSYPVKLYEAMACNVPVVAANVPGTAWVLRDHEELLAPPGDVEGFVMKAVRNIERGRINYLQQGGWENSTELLLNLLQGQ